MIRRGGLSAVAIWVVLAFAAGAARAAEITEYPVEPGAAAGANAPQYIITGPDGNLWFTDAGTNTAIRRMDTTGTAVAPIPRTQTPIDIAAHPNGSVYWTEPQRLFVRTAAGEIFPAAESTQGPLYAVDIANEGNVRWSARTAAGSGVVCKFPVSNDLSNCPGGPGQPAGGTRFTDLTPGLDGRYWVAGFEEDAVRRVLPMPPNTSPDQFELSIAFPPGSHPMRIAHGPDGNLWVTSHGADAIDRLTPAGVRTRFPLAAGRRPHDITVGPDGALWFTEQGANRIGRITTAGVVTEYRLPTAGSEPTGITMGSDGALWFTEASTGKIGRLVPDDDPGPGTDPVSNDFTFGKVKKNKRKGTAKLTVKLPGPGELDLAKTKKVKADEESVEAAGKEKLSINPKGKVKKQLSRKGKAKAKAKVTFMPTGGTPNTEGKRIKLVKR